MGLVSQFAVILAQSSGDENKSGFNVGLLVLPLMFVALYFLMIRPQRQRAAAQQRTMRQVAVGDEVLTTSGMYGIVTAMDDEDLWLEVADGVEIRVARAALMKVTQHVGDGDSEAEGDGEGDDTLHASGASGTSGTSGAIDDKGASASGAVDDNGPQATGDSA
jgi:preprotein translocase subunit YajC